MTLHSSSKRFTPACAGFSLKKSLLVHSLLACTAAWTAGASAAENAHESLVSMVGVTNYFREVCVEFGAGDKVAYEFTSAHPLDFNLHHHPERSTVFLIKKNGLTEFSTDFIASADDHYCFTWTNPADLSGVEWDISLKYQVLPKQ